MTDERMMRRVAGAYVADTARVIGDVTLGEGVSVWFGTVVRGDVGPVRIGRDTNLQDGVIVHCDHGVPNVIGERVSVGHAAVVHGAEVGDGSLIGIGAKLLSGSRIGKRCLIAAGAVVPPGLVVPDDHVVMGLPGRVVRETRPSERKYLAEIPPRYRALAELHAEHVDPRTRAFGDGPSGAGHSPDARKA